MIWNWLAQAKEWLTYKWHSSRRVLSRLPSPRDTLHTMYLGILVVTVFLLATFSFVKVGVDLSTSGLVMKGTLVHYIDVSRQAFDNVFDWLLDALFSTGQPGATPLQLRSVIAAKLFDIFLVLASVVLAVFPTIAYLERIRKLEREQVVKTIRVQRGKTDLIQMENYCRGACELTVIAGDFSWLESDSPLRRAMTELARKSKLKMVSYKDRSRIPQSVIDEFGTCLVIDKNKNGVKCSILKYSNGDRAFLYQTPIQFLGGQRHYLGVIRDSDKSQYLLECIETLCAPRRNPSIICLVGRRGSGKTTATKVLSGLGYHPINVGSVVEMLAIRSAGATNHLSLREIQDYGLKLAQDNGGAELAKKLLEMATGHSRVVFDGLRIPAVFRELKKARPETRIVYLLVDDDLRRQRLSARAEAEATDLHPIELMTDEFLRLDPLRIDSGGEISDLVARLVELAESD